MLLTPECEVQFIHVLVSVRITVAVHTCMSELRSMCKQNTVHWCVRVYVCIHHLTYISVVAMTLTDSIHSLPQML